MRSSSRLWAKMAVVGALAAVSTLSLAQGDWRTYGGDNQRSGHNALPASVSGPGRSFLRWWRPNAIDLAGSSYIIDNLPTNISLSIVQASFAGVWGAPASVASEAENAFIPPSYTNADPVTNPSYRFAYTTPSLGTADPTIPQNAAQHRIAQWDFDFTGWGAGPPRSYALYVWIPIGSTLDGIVQRYAQRYFVYEIQYGSNSRWIDVVDTYAAGTGWVRLGNGGRATTQLFQYDGSKAISIILHNTVPRNSAGGLSDTPGTTLVYADAAMAVPDYGSYRASPIVSEFGAGGPLQTHAVAALNRRSVGFREGTGTTVTKGQAISYQFDSSTGANNTRWIFEPVTESEDVNHVDNTSAGVTVNPAWGAQVLPATFFGVNYHSAAITNTLAAATDVAYAPTLEDGSYELWVWLPGSAGGVNFGTAVTYEVLEGAAPTQFTVNQDTARGWVRIGTRRFNHTQADPLRLRVTNHSVSALDLGRFAYADAVRFIGAANVEINSTPVQADVRIRLTPAGPLVDRSVTFVAAENGRIYALDSQGNSNGTTTCYWSYPSTPDRNNAAWTDPNQVAGEDGSGPIAEMPSGFDLSSALVQRILGEDYLFIGTRNGRIYCIEIAGRGDMNTTLQIPGTTRRVWSYPDDYPGRRLPSSLGPIDGSVLYGEPASGPTIYVPTTQGRIYALDAVGIAATKRTTVRWQFPAANVRPPGAIVGTPAIAFGRIYFGTQVGTGDDRGRFYALDWDTGAPIWQRNAEPAWSLNPDLQRYDDFSSGPVTIPASEMAGMPDTVVAANDSRWITAYDANTGATLWTTDELAGTVIGNLTFTHQTVYDNGAVLNSAPVVVVPVADGRIMSLFAETLRTNIFGGTSRLAWGFETGSGGLTAQVAVGRNWMYAADDAGFFYAFSDNPGTISPGPTPGQRVVAPNDPAGLPFREAQIRFVTKDTYERLRLQTGAAGHLTHAQATVPARVISRTGFEWGETVYAIVYNFPYSASVNPVPPGLAPQINYRFSTEGASIRNVTVNAKQFSSPASSPISGITGERLDGYAITSFTIQGSGSTALPPGNALATFTISAQFAPGARYQNVALNPATTRRPFAIANPLAIATQFDNTGAPLPNFSIAYTTNPDDPEAMTNGSPNVSTTPKREDLLLSNFGAVAHGQPGSSLIALVDRSLMTLIRGPGRGLDQVRAVRNELAFQGGAVAVNNFSKPINQLRYPFTEDLPTDFPNTSLDYPNLTREYISIVKDKFGNTENPLFGGVSLNAPDNGAGGAVDPNNPLARRMFLTPVDFEVAVPRFQPPNSTLVPDSNSGGVPNSAAGYYGRIDFFIDSSGNGLLDRRGRREAFRSMFLGGSVSVDERLTVETPVVDLGSLAEGAGYSPIAPNTGGSPFSPWGGAFQSFFKPFVVRNEGNVNLVNLRVAKATNTGGVGTYTSWGLFAPANHERSWLDTTMSLWSDIDSNYALNFGGTNQVLLQKARVGDRSGTTLTTNPIRRENAFLNAPFGVTQGPVDPLGPEPANPRVAVTVPIGTPVGSYITKIRIIEDSNQDESMLVDANGNSLEPYSDPTFTLRFNVRESRITNGFTTGTAPMVHGTLTGAENFLFKNVQPTALRTIGGEMVVAYASNAAGFNDPQPTDAISNDRWRLYFATLQGNSAGTSPGTNPLRDLYGWNPAGGNARWFNQSIGPFPTAAPATIFDQQAGENVLLETVKYGAPAFPVMGTVHPLTFAQNTGAYVAYIGQAEKQTAVGRNGETRLMLNLVQTNDSGVTTITGVGGDTPWVMPFDVTAAKGRPAIVQSATTASIFYAGGGTGMNGLYHTFFDGSTFSQPQPLNMGNAFESFGTPSVSARTYSGLALPDLPTGTPIIDLTFTGKLQGRVHSEVYFARLRSDGLLRVNNIPGQRTSLVYLPRRIQERVVAAGDGSTFHAAGLLWNSSDPAGNPIVLEQRRGLVTTSLEVPNTRTIDRTTGMISFDCALGGRVYLDPSMGTIRFSSAVPARDATVLLSYTPRILRISTSGGAAYTGPSGLFDNRLIGEFSYWANQINAAIAPGDFVQTGRYVFTYGRAAAGAGSAARPYLRTMRLGVQLPTAIHTQPNGNVTNIVVNGMAPGSFYQVDPANGRVYFTAPNENRTVTVTYTGVDEATGNPVGPIQAEYVVTLIGERTEAPVPIEQAVNESQLYSFIDPFDPVGAAERRAGLIWMVYTSTRGGGPDIFVQTIAPRFTPSATGRG